MLNNIKKSKFIIILLLILGIFALSDSIVITDNIHYSIITRFEKPIKFIKNPSINFKIPFLDEIVIFDKRMFDFMLKDKNFTPFDHKNFVSNVDIKLKIINIEDFYNKILRKNSNNFEIQIYNILDTNVKNIKFIDIFSENRSKILENLKNKLNLELMNYGLIALDVKIVDINFSKGENEQIINKMKQEKELELNNITLETNKIITAIQIQTEKEKQIILNNANKQANLLKNEGEVKAIKNITKAFNNKTDFYQFYKTLQIYEKLYTKQNEKTINLLKEELTKNLNLH